jgi:hypothetical protein
VHSLLLDNALDGPYAVCFVRANFTNPHHEYNLKRLGVEAGYTVALNSHEGTAKGVVNG